MIAALFLALLVRAAHLVFNAGNPFNDPAILDPKYYHEWALRITTSGWGTEVFHGLPLYPLFLALIYKVFGPSAAAVKSAQLALGLATVYFVYRTADKLFGKKAALVSACLAAVYGPLFFHEAIFIPEALGTALYAAAFYAACLFFERPSWRSGFVLGALLGLAALTKAGALLFAALFLPYFIWKGPGPRAGRVLPAACCTAGLLLILAPVTLHNFIRGKDAVLLTSHSGFNFYVGNQPGAEGVFRAPEGTGSNVEAQIEDSRAVAERALGRPLKPSEVSGYWSGRALRFIRENPVDFLKLCLRKMLLFFDAREISDVDDYAFAARFNPLLRFPWPNFALLGPFVFLGLFLIYRNRFSPLAYLWIGSYLAGLALFFINARYRLPLLPVFFTVAGVGVLECWNFIKTRSWKKVFFCALILAAGAGVTQLGLVGTNHVRDLVNAGDIFLEKKNYEEALSFYREALSIDRRHAKANLAMGVAFSRMGRYDEAKDYYLNSIDSEPTSQAYNNLGMWHDGRGEWGQAERFFMKAIELKPNSHLAHNNLGMIYGKKGRLEAAVSEFEKSLSIHPKGARALTNLGLVLHRLGRRTEARRRWEEALRVDPTFEQARQALALSGVD